MKKERYIKIKYNPWHDECSYEVYTKDGAIEFIKELLGRIDDEFDPITSIRVSTVKMSKEDFENLPDIY